MIFTECPYCDKPLTTGYAKNYGFEKRICECGKTCWIEHTTLWGTTLTDEDFQAKYILDEETKQVKERNPVPRTKLHDLLDECLKRQMDNFFNDRISQ